MYRLSSLILKQNVSEPYRSMSFIFWGNVGEYYDKFFYFFHFFFHFCSFFLFRFVFLSCFFFFYLFYSFPPLLLPHYYFPFVSESFPLSLHLLPTQCLPLPFSRHTQRSACSRALAVLTLLPPRLSLSLSLNWDFGLLTWILSSCLTWLANPSYPPPPFSMSRSHNHIPPLHIHIHATYYHYYFVCRYLRIKQTTCPLYLMLVLRECFPRDTVQLTTLVFPQVLDSLEFVSTSCSRQRFRTTRFISWSGIFRFWDWDCRQLYTIVHSGVYFNASNFNHVFMLINRYRELARCFKFIAISSRYLCWFHKFKACSHIN